MSVNRTTKPCCDSKCFANNAATEGHHPCKYCGGFMHAMCGIAYPGDEEGHGARRVCTACQVHHHLIHKSIESSSSSPIPSNRNTTSSSSTSSSTTTVIKNMKKKLPSNLVNRDADTINFNKIILQQIKSDGNLTYAMHASKGGVCSYFQFLVDDFLPTIFNPNDYVMCNSRTLQAKWKKFTQFAKKIGRTYHSTDITGVEGETLDEDVEMFLSMQEEDDYIPKKKQNETAKNRSIQESIIGNQRPLFGNVSRSQVANANKSDKNKAQKNTNVSTNMSSVETTTHRREPINNVTPQKRRKKNWNVLPTLDVDDSLNSMRNMFESIESDCKQSKEENLFQSLKNFDKLKEIEEKYVLTSDKDLSIIEMYKSVITSNVKQLMSDSNLQTPKSTTSKKSSRLLSSVENINVYDDDDDDDYEYSV
jgi:hypothetical protein